MNISRRTLLKAAIATLGVAALPQLTAATPVITESAPVYDWYTQKQIIQLYKNLCKHPHTTETLNCSEFSREHPVYNPQAPIQRDYNNLCDQFYFSVHRAKNIMYRKTLDGSSEKWLALSPATCSQQGLFYKYQFSVPSEKNKPYTIKSWQDFAKERSPGVYDLGLMNYCQRINVIEGFPDNVVMLGMGFKEVRRYKYDLSSPVNEYGIHDMICYLNKPTTKNYALIHLKGL